MEKDCIFCKIINGEIPSTKVYEDETVYAFKDIAPQAPVHVLIIPKAHVLSAIREYDEEKNGTLLAHVFGVAVKIAKDLGLDNGYRIVTNVGEDGCQSVKHLHFHLLGGTKLTESMA